VNGPVLRATRLRKGYDTASGRIEVVVEASLEIGAGELVVLTGPSGSGKSTLLALLAGFEQPDAGTVERAGGTDGEVVAWEDLAVVPQALALPDELPLIESVLLPLRLRGVPAAERVARAGAIVEQLGLGAVARRVPAQASLGEQQRAAIARAIVVAPRLVVLDEPTAHQDAASTGRIVRVLESAARDGAGVLVATHDPALGAVADRRLHLTAGRLEELGLRL
jgi:putative ABC transport system ATP-binding protein